MVSERFSSVGGPTGLVLDSGTAESRARRPADQQGLLQPDALGGHALVHVFVQPRAGRGQAADDAQRELYVLASHRRTCPTSCLPCIRTWVTRRQKLACTNVDAVGNDPFDPNAAPPLTQATCDTLYTHGRVRRTSSRSAQPPRRIRRTVRPTRTAMRSFAIQHLQGHGRSLDAEWNDPANRVGELWSRTDVIKYMYSHFVKAAQIGPAAANSQ